MDDVKPVEIQRIAVKALITDDAGNYLLLREAKTYDEGTNTGRYHLPGGRLDMGEHFETGLRREVMEETGLNIEIVKPIYVGEWSPVIKGVQHQIVGIFFLCRTYQTEITLSEEHDEYRWMNPSDESRVDIMPPEEKVIARYLHNLSLKDNDA